MPQTSHIRVGMAGWTYEPWRGVFYPKGVTQKNELNHASRQVNSIELNGSFYSLQKPSSYQKWHDQTPDNFVFSIKGGRFITHIRRLRDVREPVANFVGSGIFCLGKKLGPILWQLPPSLKFDEAVLAEFLGLLPQTTSAAIEMFKQHGTLKEQRFFIDAEEDRPLRYVIEPRHASFHTPRFIELLRQHKVAACVADTAGKWPVIEDVTADFVYCRLHGDETIYVSGYTDDALNRWEKRVRAWSAGEQPADARLAAPDLKPRERSSRDVFVYFDNDVKVRAPFDAMSLADRLGVKPKTAAPASAPPPPETLAEEAREHWPPIKRPSKRKRPPG